MKTIPLTNGGETMVDDDVYEWASKFKWSRHDNKCKFWTRSYVYRRCFEHGKKITKYLHIEIIGKKEGFLTDHINHDGLDNRRENLRFATRRQNKLNTPRYGAKSPYKGVCFAPRNYDRADKTKKRWKAQIKINGKNINLGRYETPEEAAKVYDIACAKMSGEFACLNNLG